MWSKDTIRKDGIDGPVIGSRFMNVKKMQPDGTLEQIRLYEFNDNLELTKTVSAKNARYLGNHEWQLNEVVDRI